MTIRGGRREGEKEGSLLGSMAGLSLFVFQFLMQIKLLILQRGCDGLRPTGGHRDSLPCLDRSRKPLKPEKRIALFA